MPIINKGTSFSNGEQLTADKINNLLDLATFNQSATDSASTTVNSASQIVVADSGITTAKLATDAVETAKIKDTNVTFAKLADVIDSDTMTGASATTLATSESIKAYVDTSKTSAFVPASYAGEESVTLPNGLIMKFGIATGVTAEGGNPTIIFAVPFPAGVVNAQATTTNASGGTSSSYDYYYQIESTSVSSLTLTQQNATNPTSAAHNVHWMVIGR